MTLILNLRILEFGYRDDHVVWFFALVLQRFGDIRASREAEVKSKLFAILEIALVYTVIRMVTSSLHSTNITGWELERLGWSYTGMLLFVGIPALLLLLTHRDWAEYGVTLVDWQFNLDLGIKAYLVRIIPVAFLLGTTLWLNLNFRTLPGGVLIAAGEILGLVLMLVILQRSRPEKAFRSARNNMIVMVLLLMFPILLAALMGKLSPLIVSTVLWQFFFSGFGEEFVWRGYVQTRLNQAFGRPFHLMGIRFGAGLVITSILFGLFHAFNTWDPTVGVPSLAWGWALFTTFSGMLFGILREKTGSLLAPGIAHGLPDAVGEALAILFNWM